MTGLCLTYDRRPQPLLGLHPSCSVRSRLPTVRVGSTDRLIAARQPIYKLHDMTLLYRLYCRLRCYM